jgi:hypothetical protein
MLLCGVINPRLRHCKLDENRKSVDIGRKSGVVRPIVAPKGKRSSTKREIWLDYFCACSAMNFLAKSAFEYVASALSAFR